VQQKNTDPAREERKNFLRKKKKWFEENHQCVEGQTRISKSRFAEITNRGVRSLSAF
jgi:hypothetical protein